MIQAESWEIQTNETARGVTWLLPAALLQIEAAYLVELGASAGLNLLADLRRFDLRWSDGGELRLGLGEAPQFVIECEGPRPSLPSQVRPPEIVGRTGADARVVDLDLPDAETQLAACIWGDQPLRMQRLQEALVLRRGLRGTPQAARMLKARLPDETEEMLRAAVPVHPVAPVILFDTYVTAYFNDVDHRALVRAIEAFAGHGPCATNSRGCGSASSRPALVRPRRRRSAGVAGGSRFGPRGIGTPWSSAGATRIALGWLSDGARRADAPARARVTSGRGDGIVPPSP